MKRTQLIRAISFGMLAIFLGITIMVQPSNQVFAGQTALTVADGQAQPSGKAERTVMIYMCGSDLESGSAMGTHNLKQVLQSNFSASGDVKCVVMTGGSKRWNIESDYLVDSESGQNPVAISKKCNQIWEARGADAQENPGKLVLLDKDGISGDGEGAKRSEDELMSDPKTLKAFISYCVREYPANRYDLVLWDHGEGPIGGYALDKHDEEEKMMSFPDVVDALSDNDVIKGDGSGAQGTFDLLSFDTCLMNTVELNLALAGLTDCYVASAETEPGFGQDYRGWFKAIGQTPDMNPY